MGRPTGLAHLHSGYRLKPADRNEASDVVLGAAGHQLFFASSHIGFGCDFGEHVVLARHPDVESGEEEDAHHEVGDQAAHDNDGEGALGVGADIVGERGG